MQRREKIPIKDIGVSERVRQDMGNIEALANSIHTVGLINPITVIKQPESQRYSLLAGARRLAACVKIGWTEIDATVFEETEE